MSTKTMTLLIKPILLAFIKSDSVKQLIVDILEAYVKRTDNKLDDKALEIVKEKLFSYCLIKRKS